jgi:hypothetical protein
MDPKVLAGVMNTSTGRCWSSDTYNVNKNVAMSILFLYANTLAYLCTALSWCHRNSTIKQGIHGGLRNW